MTATERAERLMKGAAKVLAFPEKLTPSVKAMAEDSYEVARELLRLCPAEEGEPLTDSILRSVFGFRQDGMHLALCEWGPRRNGTMQVYPVWNGAKGEWFVNGSQIVPPKTVGEVRRLFAALSISLVNTK